MLNRFGLSKMMMVFVLMTGVVVLGNVGVLIWSSHGTIERLFDASNSSLGQVELKASLIKAMALAHSNSMAAAADPDKGSQEIRGELADGFLKEFSVSLEKCGNVCAELKPLYDDYQSQLKTVRSALASGKGPNTEELGSRAEAIFEKLDKLVSVQGAEARAVLNGVKLLAGKTEVSFGLGAGSFVLVFLVVGILFQRTVNNALKGMSKNVSENIKDVNGIAISLHSGSQELNEASSRQMSAIHQTSTAVKEIASTATSVTKGSEETQTLTREAITSAEMGVAQLNELKASIAEISEGNSQLGDSVQRSLSELGEMVKMISEIRDKTRVINDIVFQTKLLSFNASVEAARAGEHGKGFAVVAEEVGNLARMSGRSADEITKLLQQSTAQVESIVRGSTESVEKALSVGKRRIEDGQAKAQLCSESFDKIVASLDQVRVQVDEVVLAIQQQGVGISEIAEATHQVADAGEASLESIQLVASHAKNLKDQAVSLQQIDHSLNALISGGSTSNTSVEAVKVVSLMTTNSKRGAFEEAA